MTYQSQALATAGLVALWMLTDSPGSASAADLGPNNLPLTYAATGKADGVENILGAGAGFAPSTTLYASRAVAVGSPLDLTAGQTIVLWATPTSTVNGIIAGRTNHLRVGEVVNNGVGFGCVGWGGGTVDCRTQAFGGVGVATCVASTFDGRAYRTFINGVPLMKKDIPGALPVTLPSVAGTFQVGASGGTFTGTVSGVGVWNRALNAGEIRALFEQGTTVAPVSPGVSIDNLYNSSNTQVALAAAGTPCAECSGLRKVNEAKFTQGTNVYHPACYGVAGIGKTITVPTAATPYSGYEGQILSTLNLVMGAVSQRVTSWTKPNYYDGSRMQNASVALTGQYDVYLPWVLTGAIIARHMKLPRQHKFVSMGIDQIEHLWTLQEANGHIALDAEYAAGGGSDFITGTLGEAILYFKGYVDANTWARWQANFLAIGTYDQTVPSAIQSEANFYINGNREAGALWGYYMMYLVSGKQQAWLDFYNSQYTYVTTYESKARAGINNGNFGFVTVVADNSTQQDGRNGKGYLIERKTATVPAGHVLSPVDGTTILDGYDPNYVSLGTQFLIRLYLHSQDARILKIINMQYNLLSDLANQTSATVNGIGPWLLNGTDGSRQANTADFGVPILPFINVVAGRTSTVTPTMLAGAFAEAVRFETIDLLNNAAVSRDANNLATWLMMLPTWPGDPVVS